MSITDTRHEEERDADEEDSLFGSPPPSPGRPASPALALPSAGYFSGRSSASTAPTQNVGTIALPGSHPDSELPINPLALSLNHGIVHRPPALPHQVQSRSQSPWQSSSAAYGQQGPVTSVSLVRGGMGAPPAAQPHTWNASASTSTQRKPTTYGQHGPMTSTSIMHGGTAPTAQPPTRPASASTSAQPKKPLKKRTRPSTRDEPPPKPTGPEFPLPDPTAPPPTHFLRNQENLLGRAGRIAHVKPANLTHTRGSTPSNPILVDDADDERPALGRRPPSSERTQPYIDPALLTAPTNQEIVSVLIGQKDIFPILEGVLKLVVGSTPATYRKTGFEHTAATPTQDQAAIAAPAPKKRKLNRVPAGATDWDVPYPFPQGEGPEEYHKTWERERGKQLISQLIQLIKSAARKAATKKYLAEHKPKANQDAASNEKQKGQHLPKEGSETATGMVQEGHSSCDVLQDTSNTPSPSRSSIPVPPTSALSQTPSLCPNPQPSQTHAPSEMMEPSMAAAFDQLMSSLDSLPDQGSSQTPPNQHFVAPPNTSSFYEPGSTGTTPNPTPADQPLFDTWMSFLESFPMNFDGTMNSAVHPITTTTPLSSTTEQSSTTPTPGTGTPLGNFDLASMGGAEMAGALDNDFDALWALMFQQHPQQPPQLSDSGLPQINTDSSNFAAPPPPPTFEDHLIDPNLLALSLQSQAASGANMDANVDSIHQAISPIASGSSSTFGGSTSPGTPASAGWEQSMPDVFMGGGGSSSGMEGGMEGQAWAGNGGGGSEDVMMDFGIFPEDVQDVQALGGGYPASAKGKGKESDVGVAPTANVSRSITVSIPTPTPTPAPPTSSLPQFQPQLQFSSSSQLGLQYDTFLSTKLGTVPKTFSRQLRRADIIKRAEEQKRLIQKELDAVKTRLWETTIEQAGLVTLQKRLGSNGNGVRGGGAVS